MASLQSIRNKGGWIVASVIGLALLAFVLGDFLGSGSTLFGASQNNVGEINGKKIGYQEYSNKLNYFTDITTLANNGNSPSGDEESENMRNQTWDYLIRENALKPSLEDLGLKVSKAEMIELLGGSHTSPMLAQMFSDPQTGVFNHESFGNFVKNASQEPRSKMFWGYLQSEIGDNALLTKLKSVIDQGTYVTNFEADKYAALESNVYSVRFVANKLTSVSDSLVSVSESDAKKFYDDHKSMFKTGTKRNIEYVVFQTLPSPDDYSTADKYIKQLAQEFEASENVMQFVSLNSQTASDKRYYREGELPSELDELAFKGDKSQMYGPVLSADVYTLARISDVKTVPDSVKVSHIVFMPDQKPVADSLLNVLRKGGDFVKVAQEYSVDKQTSDKGGEVGTFDPQTMPEIFSAPILNAKKGEVILVETPQALHIMKIDALIGEGKKVQLATIKYTIEPSETTRTNSFREATTFATEAVKNFDAAVDAKTLAKRVAELNPTDKELQGYAHSREIVRWAYGAKVNEISKVMEFGDNNIVAVLRSITEEGIQSFADAKEVIVSYLRSVRKGEMLAEKMKGTSSLEDLAAKISTDVIEASDINWNTYVVPEVGMDPAFAGGISGMDASKISKPIIGRAAVYVAQIVDSASTPVDKAVEKAKIKAESQQSSFMSAYQAIMEKFNIKDFRYKFY